MPHSTLRIAEALLELPHRPRQSYATKNRILETLDKYLLTFPACSAAYAARRNRAQSHRTFSQIHEREPAHPTPRWNRMQTRNPNRVGVVAVLGKCARTARKRVSWITTMTSPFSLPSFHSPDYHHRHPVPHLWITPRPHTQNRHCQPRHRSARLHRLNWSCRMMIRVCFLCD